MKDPLCDSDSGTCAPAAVSSGSSDEPAAVTGTELIYVGDPMCSWCWGIAPELQLLREECERRQMSFRVVVGGLRPGGGDFWNEQARQTLAHHWQEVHKRSGQPFKFDLLDLPSFDYDTEPACRAVVAARSLRAGSELDFFFAIQHQFYAENEDPKLHEFYRGICADLDLDFDAFLERFESGEVKAQTREEFQISRNWGIRGYPSVLLLAGDRLYAIASGYSPFEQMRQRLDSLLAVPA